MNKDFRIRVGFPNHPKTRKFTSELGIVGIAYLVLLWDYFSEHAPRGFIKQMSDVFLAEICRWDGDPAALRDALQRHQWIQVSDQVGLEYLIEVVDWKDNQGWVYHEPERRKKASELDNIRWSKEFSGIAVRNAGSNAQRNAPYPSPNPSPSPNPNPKTKVLNTLSAKGADEELFAQFWLQYPRKEKRKNAFEAFGRLKLSESEFENVMAGLARQKMSEQWTRDGGKYIPHPTSWLNGRRWEDEGIQDDYAATPPGSAGTKFEKNMAVLDRALQKAKGEGENGGQKQSGQGFKSIGNDISGEERERRVRGDLPGTSGGHPGRSAGESSQGVPAEMPVLPDDSGDQGKG